MASQQGFCEALLLHLDQIAGQNYPGKKVTVPGFTQMLYDQPNNPTAIQEGYSDGHKRTVNIKYAQRGTVGQVSTTDTCAVDVQPVFKESTVSIDNIVSKGFWIPDSQMRQYCRDASASVAIGQPATPVMAQMLDFMLTGMNSLYQKMETILTTEMATTFGKHVATGSSTAVAVNIEQDSTLNDLTAGLTKMLTDAAANEFCDTPMFVGGLGSLMHSYDIQSKFRALQSAGTAFDAQAIANMMPFKFYASGITGTTWGAQNVGMFAPDSCHILEYMQNVGDFAGTRGNSTFSTFVDPRTQCWSPSGLSNIRFDLQVRYADCPEDVADFISSGYLSNSSISGRGYLVRVYKYYDLFVTPSDAFDGADRLAGSNGTLRYNVSNT